jgi:Mg2+-importing ATPase
MNQRALAFWSISGTEILQHLGTTKEGLSGDEARQRLARYGSNLLKPQERSDVLTLLLAQFKSPLILIFLFATGLSFFLHDPVNALIILTIVLVSGLLGYWQEHSAANAVEKLLAIVQIRLRCFAMEGPKKFLSKRLFPEISSF